MNKWTHVDVYTSITSLERYRLQTDSFSVIGIFLDELIIQLERHHDKKVAIDVCDAIFS